MKNGFFVPPKTVVYVARDLERALPLAGKKGYFIITNSSPFAKLKAKEFSNVVTVDSKEVLDTHELLINSQTKKIFKKLEGFYILVFKNTGIIEKICEENKWALLNPSSKTSNKIEEKNSQIEWLAELKELLPPHKQCAGKELSWNGKKFIVQFNRAHTGTGTLIIDSMEQVTKIQKDFPNRPIKISEFINGFVITSNNIIINKKVITGSVSYQITGLQPFTSNQFATIGNDWSLPQKMLTKEQFENFNEIASSVGKKMVNSGWKGLFGIDAIIDEKTGKVYLLEINARQPASTSFESYLQLQQNPSTVSLIEGHLISLLDQKIGEDIEKVQDGAQIILRVSENSFNIKEIVKELENLGLICTPYENNRLGQDLLRIQGKKGIMSAHGEFNELGKKIKQIVEKYG